MDSNRRLARRLPVNGAVYFRSGHGVFRRGQLVDVSPTGVGLICGPETPPPDTVAFRLEGSPPLLFPVRTAWQTPDGRVGLELLQAPATCDVTCLSRWLQQHKKRRRKNKRAS